MAKKLRLLKDDTGSAIQVMALSAPHDVDGTSQAAQSNAIDGECVRISAVTGPLRFLIGDNPTAQATSHYLAEGDTIYQPCEVGDKVSVLGGKANIATAGM